MASESETAFDQIIEIREDACYFGGIPIEAVLEVLSFLHPRELAMVARLSSDYYPLTLDDQLWKPLCRGWGFLSPGNARPAGGWKKYFKKSIDEDKQAAMEADRAAAASARKNKQLAAEEEALYSDTFGSYTKGEFVVMNGRPCELLRIKKFPLRRMCRRRAWLTGRDLLTGAEIIILDFDYESPTIPEVEKEEYIVTGVDVEGPDLINLMHPVYGDDQVVTCPPNTPLGAKLREYWEQDEPVEIRATLLSVTWSVRHGAPTQKGEAIAAVRTIGDQ